MSPRQLSTEEASTFPNLQVSVGSLSFKNPVLGASGTFGYGVEFADLLDLNELGGFVTKGLSLKPRKGNAPSRIHETACGMLNSIGLHNIGVEAFLREKLPKLAGIRTNVIVNVYGETPDDFVEVARSLSGARGIAGIEVNVSCPNVVKGGLDLGTDPIEVRKLLDRIRHQCNLPMWAKLTPNVTDIKSLAKAAIDGGAEALSLINSVKGLALDWRKKTTHLSNRYGGLTGPAIKPVALAKVFEVAEAFSIPIVGIGGITCADDVLEFMVAGASAIQVGTQNFVQSNACIQIVEGLTSTLMEARITNVRSLIGSIHRKNA